MVDIPSIQQTAMTQMKPSIQMQRKFQMLSTMIKGTTDDDIGIIWYRDADNDGIYNENIITYSCEKPDGYVSTFGDCKQIWIYRRIDSDAVEFCDYIDNDCDGLFDEEEAINKPTWYLDADNVINFGTTSNSVQSCQKPVGYK